MHLEGLHGDPNRRSTVALRHDQILNGVLFDPAKICGILPSHTEEMDQEVAFRHLRIYDTLLKLIDGARREIAKHKSKAQHLARLSLELDQTESGPSLRAQLVDFVRVHAPALTAILEERFTTPAKRLDAVLDRSQLTLVADVRWEDLGVRPETAEILRNLDPDPDAVARLRSDLEAFTYRQNSDEANYVDSKALAHLVSLQQMLRREAPHVRVALVSRARTLLRAARDLARKTGSELLVRHPRMLALTSREAIALDAASELTLRTALEIWQSKLRGLPDLEESELRAHAPFTEALAAFVTAWDAFEGSRLALETRWRGVEGDAPSSGLPAIDTLSDRKLAGRLIRMFSQDASANELLRDTLIEKFEEFGKAASRFLRASGNLDLRARVRIIDGRVHLTPIATVPVGPLEVSAWPGCPEDEELPLDVIAERVLQRSERPLIWSLALAAAHGWRQAAIFARSAFQLAELDNDVDSADEALLLRAEIRRLGAYAAADGDDEEPRPEMRYNISMCELARVRQERNKVRRLREEAAQTLEAALCRALDTRDLPERITRYFSELNRVVDEVALDEVKARSISLMLALYCFDKQRHNLGFLGRHKLTHKKRHEQLAALLRDLGAAGMTDAVPYRARALDIIAYDSRNEPVPSKLRGELIELRKGLLTGTDEIARFLHQELSLISLKLRLLHTPKLQLAPVPLPPPILDALRNQHAELFALASSAFEQNERVGRTLLNLDLDAEQEPAVVAAQRSLEQALKFVTTQHVEPRLLFYLRTELLYAKLIAAEFMGEHARNKRHAALIEEYAALAREFPDRTLPQVRLAYLADRLGDLGRERDALEEARRRVDAEELVPHWLQSCVRRLCAIAHVRQCPGAVMSWTGLSTEKAKSQAEVLADSCRTLLEAERRNVELEGRDIHWRAEPAHELERVRRINNLVFYASRLIERRGSEHAFRTLLPELTLHEFAQRLMPEGIDNLSEPYILHTLGCYYAAVGKPGEAYRAGKRIVDLVFKGGKEMTSLAADEAKREAYAWYSAGPILQATDA